jgi:hypothetical protein
MSNWKYKPDRGICYPDGRQMCVLLSTASLREDQRLSRLVVDLLNEYCEPNKQGRPVLTKGKEKTK